MIDGPSDQYVPDELQCGQAMIAPKDIEAGDFANVQPEYEANETLNRFVRVMMQNGMGADPAIWRQLFRIDSLEEMGRPKKRGSDEVTPSFSEIADTNFQEMERATVEKWTLALNQFFHSPEIQNLQLHNPDGRIKIAIPGCFLGFEIGAILDFFNEQNLPVDIEAADTGAAGDESKFMNLPERQGQIGSTVQFHSDTDAKELFAETKQDIVVFRHPGPVFDQNEAAQWHQIFQDILKTDPSVIIVSTFDYEVSPETASQELGNIPDRKILESDIFIKWLAEAGYSTPQNEFSAIKDDSLYYPMNPYNFTPENELENKRVCDRNMFIAVKNK